MEGNLGNQTPKPEKPTHRASPFGEARISSRVLREKFEQIASPAGQLAVEEISEETEFTRRQRVLRRAEAIRDSLQDKVRDLVKKQGEE